MLKLLSTSKLDIVWIIDIHIEYVKGICIDSQIFCSGEQRYQRNAKYIKRTQFGAILALVA